MLVNEQNTTLEMFSIFKNTEVALDGFPFLGIDMHAHFLPGIDDGAANLEESFRLIDGLISLGYEELIATPHIMGDLYKNTPETIQASYDLLKAEMDTRGYTLPVSFAAEYLIDEQFEGKIKSGPLLTFGDNFVLVETMFMGLPPNIKEILFALETEGYHPILAHPERYHFVDEKLKSLDDFLDRGVLLQSNILSLAGYYGQREKDLAEMLLENELISFYGTDIHHLRHLRALQKFSVPKKVASNLHKFSFKNRELKRLK